MSKSKLTASALIMYLTIPVIGNGAYFWGCQGHYPGCGLICMIFFNISFLTLFLPFLTNDKRHEMNQKSGQSLLAALYLIIESILAMIFILNYVDSTPAGVVQILLFGVFMLVYFGVNNANTHSVSSRETFRNARSNALIEANSILRVAISENRSSAEKDILRSALSELTTTPASSASSLNGIDERILAATEELCGSPTKELYSHLSRLLAKRKTMAMLSFQ